MTDPVTWSMYRVTMEHTITVVNTMEVRAIDLDLAESFAAHRWKMMPTNEADRKHMRTSISPTKFTTTKLET